MRITSLFWRSFCPGTLLAPVYTHTYCMLSLFVSATISWQFVPGEPCLSPKRPLERAPVPDPTNGEIWMDLLRVELVSGFKIPLTPSGFSVWSLHVSAWFPQTTCRRNRKMSISKLTLGVNIRVNVCSCLYFSPSLIPFHSISHWSYTFKVQWQYSGSINCLRYYYNNSRIK